MKWWRVSFVRTHDKDSLLLHSISRKEFVDEAGFIESAQDLVINQIFDLDISELGITKLHQPLNVT